MTGRPLDPHDREPLYQQLAGLLRGQIMSGELAGRRPLPSKRALKQEHGVSGWTVDSAMAVLRDEGLIETVQGKGLFVVPEDERR